MSDTLHTAGEHESGQDDATVDAFHRGRFWLVQPARRGHRAGTDAMMLAAAVPSGFSGRIADMGAGAGAAGLAVAARCPKAHVTLVENAQEMAEFARRSIALEANAHLAARCEVLEADVRHAGEALRRGVLAGFDFAIMNPPFNRAVDRASPDVLRRQAHVMEDALVFESWLETAGGIVKPGGGVAVVARPQSLPSILAGMNSRFGDLEIKPLQPRADRPATRIVVRAWRGAKHDIGILPPLVLHETGHNRLSEQADAISSGQGSLYGD